MKPYLQDADFTLYNGDALETLRELPAESVHMCVTSPPFFGLRNYQTGSWIRPEWSREGRLEAIKEAEEWLKRSMTLVDARAVKQIYDDADCTWRSLATQFANRYGFDWQSNQIAGMDLWLGAQAYLGEHWDEDEEHEHDEIQARGGKGGSGTLDKRSANAMPSTVPAGVCSCGAEYHDRQIGLEATPEEWVASLVAVFDEVKRVLRKDGTLWVECGDSYANNHPNPTQDGSQWEKSGLAGIGSEKYRQTLEGGTGRVAPKTGPGLKNKDLIGQPFLLAFALREAGWYWRNVCIWHKPNPMPESVRDRFTVSHSYVLLFSKSPRYFFDAEAVREPAEFGFGTDPTGRMFNRVGNGSKSPEHIAGGKGHTHEGGRNARSVWQIATEPLSEPHYAAFPQALAERCIKAGTSERGCCPECGAPWVREVDVELTPGGNGGPGGVGRDLVGHRDPMPRMTKTTTTTGWRPSCHCGHEYGPDGEYGGGGPRIPIPCTILDPFLGSGTSALVARRLNRRCIGIELNPTYCELIARRTQQLSLEADDGSYIADHANHGLEAI